MYLPVLASLTAYTLPTTPAVAGMRSVQPVMAVPAIPVAVAGLGLLTLLGIRKASQDRDSFFSMKWNAEAGASAEDEACVFIGEEASEEGKQWFVCTDGASVDGADCKPVEGWGNGSAKDGEKLCKVPKVGEA